MTVRRTTFLNQSLLLAATLVAVSQGVAWAAGWTGALAGIALAAGIGLLCFVPTYYLMAWAVGRSGNLMVYSVCLGLPVRFGIAFGAVWLSMKWGLVESDYVLAWVGLFYIAHLVHESIILELQHRNADAPVAAGQLKEER